MLQEKNDVINFLEKDINSRICAGKKESITRKKVKKQKRFLCDTMLNLHKKFIVDFPHKKISYTKFCRLRPFCIIQPNCKDRDTCLCTVHANFKLIVNKAHAVGMINARSSKEVIASLTCFNVEKTKEDCLERNCHICFNKSLVWNEFDNFDNEPITYYQWLSKKN